MNRIFSSTLSRVVASTIFASIIAVIAALTTLAAVEDYAERAVHERAAGHGFELTWTDLDLRLWGEVKFIDLEVRRSGVMIATFDDFRVDARMFSSGSLTLNPPIHGITASGGTVAPPLAWLAARGAANADGSSGPEVRAGLMRVFGGEPPQVDLTDVVVEMSHLGGPVSQVTVRSFAGEVDERAWRGAGSLKIESRDDRVELPETAEFEVALVQTDDGWEPGNSVLSLESPAIVTHDGHRIAFAGLRLDAERRVSLTDVGVSPAGVGTTITASSIEIRPLEAVIDRRVDDIEEVRVRGAKLEVPNQILALAGSARSVERRERAVEGSWNSRLSAAWDEAFAGSDAVLRNLSQKLPPLVIFDDAELTLVDPATKTTLVLSAVDVLFMGDSEEPRLSVRARARSGDNDLGRFSVLATSGANPKLVFRAEGLDAAFFQQKLHAYQFIPWKVPITGRIDLELEATEDHSGAHPFAGSLTLRNVEVSEPGIAEDPVTIRRASYQFEGRHAPAARVADGKLLSNPLGYASISSEDQRGAIEIDRGILKVGEVSAEFTFEVYGLGALPDRLPARVDLQIDLPPTDVADLWDAIPPAIRGELTDAKFRGQASVTFDGEFPLRNASASRWDADTRLQNFRIVDLPHAVDVRRMLRQMDITIRDAKVGYEQQVRIPAMRSDRDARGESPRPPWKDRDPDVGECGQYVYVPADYISHHLRNGVLTTEDGSFYSHEGFNFTAIRNAMERNLREGEFVRGASTISMQLVKNLFLNGNKTLARKAREAFLVWLMESVVRVPKGRILEIYFNIIEYGPGIYGINHASQYFFGKYPDELDVNEVAWFISTLPNPKYYHRYFERGMISGVWWAKMQRYLDAMYRRGRLDEYELLTAKARRPRFRPAEAVCGPGHHLNDSDRYADEIEPMRALMHHLRVVQDRDASEVLEYIESLPPGSLEQFNPRP